MWPSVRELVGDGLDQGRVVVAERVDGDAAEQVEVLLAVGVPDVGALAAGEHQLRRAEGVHQRGRRTRLLVHVVMTSSCWRLPGPLVGDAGQHLGADALVGEQLEEHGVRLAAVDHGGRGDAALDGLQAGLHLRAPCPLARLGISSQRLGADLLDHVVAVAASRGRGPRRR